MTKIFFYPEPRECGWLAVWLGECHTLKTPLALVGGCVRDWLLSRRVHDIDAVGLSAFDPKALFHTLNRFLPGIKGPYPLKGTKDLRYLYAHPNLGITFDILPLRAESLKADLMLRDFTVNALIGLANPSHDGLIFADPLGEGFRDISQMRLKTPKDPFLTLKDDPVRAIRALRLAHTLGLLLEPGLKATLLSLSEANPFKDVAVERLRQEMERALMDPGLEIKGFIENNLKLGLAKALADKLGISKDKEQIPYEGIDVLFQSLPRLPWIRSGLFFLLIFQSLEGACQALLDLGYAKKKVRITRKALDRILKTSYSKNHFCDDRVRHEIR